MFAGLPNMCYTTNEVTKETIAVKKGEVGYWQLKEPRKSTPADELNKQIGVSKAQAEAMKMGSMFGWDVPSSNPKMYDENGIPKKDDDDDDLDIKICPLCQQQFTGMGGLSRKDNKTEICDDCEWQEAMEDAGF